MKINALTILLNCLLCFLFLFAVVILRSSYDPGHNCRWHLCKHMGNNEGLMTAVYSKMTFPLGVTWLFTVSPTWQTECILTKATLNWNRLQHYCVQEDINNEGKAEEKEGEDVGGSRENGILPVSLHRVLWLFCLNALTWTTVFISSWPTAEDEILRLPRKARVDGQIDYCYSPSGVATLSPMEHWCSETNVIVLGQAFPPKHLSVSCLDITGGTKQIMIAPVLCVSHVSLLAPVLRQQVYHTGLQLKYTNTCIVHFKLISLNLF